MVLENYLKQIPVHHVRKHCEKTICHCWFLGSNDKNWLHCSHWDCLRCVLCYLFSFNFCGCVRVKGTGLFLWILPWLIKQVCITYF